jgi:hypothetical protein
MDEIVEPRQKTHDAQQIKQIIADENADSPDHIEQPERFAKIGFYARRRLPYGNKQACVGQQDKEVIRKIVANA